MPSSKPNRETQQHLHTLSEALGSGTLKPVRRMLNSLAPADISHLLESSPPKLRHAIWQMLELENEGEILAFLSEEVKNEFLQEMDSKEVLAVTEGLEADDIADILQQLPKSINREVLQSMRTQDRHRVERVLTYDEDSAGGLMNTDTITVRPRFTLDVVLRYLRRHEEIPEMTDSLIVVNRSDQFIGLLPLNKMLVSDPVITVREIMDTEVKPILADLSAQEVALLFERHDWVSAPVTDQHGKLLGRITIDDVVDVIRDDAEHSLMSMAGLDDDEDTFSPVFKTAPKRAIWLGINLCTAFLASGVISLFEDTLDKVVALAILMPIVASMGGVAGSQSLTIVIRGIALRQIGKNNASWLIQRELAVAVLNGFFWAFIVATVATLWFGDPIIGFIIALAMVINLITAALVGTMLPVGLKILKVDPALAGSVILTTITDVVGFMSFLGLATWFYA